MGNDAFFIESDQQHLNFKELYAYVMGSEPPSRTYKGADVDGFLKAFIKAICRNVDFTVLDLDFTNSEINELINDIELGSEPHEQVDIHTHEDLVASVMKSKSRITLFTSGTTGVPKKVTHSIKNLTSQVRLGSRYQKNVWALAYNPTHIAGIQVIFQALLNENSMVYVFDKGRTHATDLIIRNQVTHISATPTYYRLLFNEEQTMNKVTRVSVGGEKSDGYLHQKLRLMFPNAKVNNIYASTEAGTLLASDGENFSIPHDVRQKIRIIANEIQVHKEILGNADQVTLKEGDWYATGDMIEWTNRSGGLFKIIGRDSEMINVGGNKVNPSEVEAAMETHKHVVKARIFGKPNSVLGNILVGEVVTNNAEVSDLELKTFLSNILQPFKIPRLIKFVDDIQLSRTGKVERKK